MFICFQVGRLGEHIHVITTLVFSGTFGIMYGHTYIVHLVYAILAQANSIDQSFCFSRPPSLGAEPVGSANWVVCVMSLLV